MIPLVTQSTSYMRMLIYSSPEGTAASRAHRSSLADEPGEMGLLISFLLVSCDFANCGVHTIHALHAACNICVSSTAPTCHRSRIQTRYRASHGVKEPKILFLEGVDEDHPASCH